MYEKILIYLADNKAIGMAAAAPKAFPSDRRERFRGRWAA